MWDYIVDSVDIAAKIDIGQFVISLGFFILILVVGVPVVIIKELITDAINKKEEERVRAQEKAWEEARKKQYGDKI